jgi:hypothetical protein
MAGLVPAIHGFLPAMPTVLMNILLYHSLMPDKTVFSSMAGSKPGHDGKADGARFNSYRYKSPTIYFTNQKYVL